MALSKEDRKLFDRLNKRYKVFKKRGVTSNAWELIQNELLNVYMEAAEKRGMDISRINFKQNLFTLSKNVDPETLAQMEKIAEYAENTKSTSFAYYKKSKGIHDDRLFKTYQSLKGTGQVSDLQDFIDFIDDMENVRNNISDLINKLYQRLGRTKLMSFLSYVEAKGISEPKKADIIERALATVLNGDPLLFWLKNEVDKVYNEQQKDREFNR